MSKKPIEPRGVKDKLAKVPSDAEIFKESRLPELKELFASMYRAKEAKEPEEGGILRFVEMHNKNCRRELRSLNGAVNANESEKGGIQSSVVVHEAHRLEESGSLTYAEAKDHWNNLKKMLKNYGPGPLEHIICTDLQKQIIATYVKNKDQSAAPPTAQAIPVAEQSAPDASKLECATEAEPNTLGATSEPAQTPQVIEDGQDQDDTLEDWVITDGLDENETPNIPSAIGVPSSEGKDGASTGTSTRITAEIPRKCRAQASKLEKSPK